VKRKKFSWKRFEYEKLLLGHVKLAYEAKQILQSKMNEHAKLFKGQLFIIVVLHNKLDNIVTTHCLLTKILFQVNMIYFHITFLLNLEYVWQVSPASLIVCVHISL